MRANAKCPRRAARARATGVRRLVRGRWSCGRAYRRATGTRRRRPTASHRFPPFDTRARGRSAGTPAYFRVRACRRRDARPVEDKATQAIRTWAFVLSNSRAGRGVEQKNARRIGRDRKPRSDFGLNAVRQSRDDETAAMADVHERVRAELLDHLDGTAHAAVALCHWMQIA